MAVVPLTGHVIISPLDKTVGPYPATIAGYYNITGLTVGGGPILDPPPEKPPGLPPDWEVWPNPPEGIAPLPEHPIYFPPDLPPVDPPTTPEPPHLGWNWYDNPDPNGKDGWYHLYVPGAGQASPKTP